MGCARALGAGPAPAPFAFRKSSSGCLGPFELQASKQARESERVLPTLLPLTLSKERVLPTCLATTTVCNGVLSVRCYYCLGYGFVQLRVLVAIAGTPAAEAQSAKLLRNCHKHRHAQL